jgi:diguanylate cyclase (GGDEF)-like protein
VKVAELMSSPLLTVHAERSVRHAAELMERLGVGSLVVEEHGIVVGIVTSRDIRLSHPNRLVADAMTRDPVCVPAEQLIWEALRTMERLKIKRLLVRDGGRACGIVTRNEIRLRISKLQDAMTGLFRPAYVQAIAEKLMAEGVPFHLLFIDVNDFREVNKQYGHPVGDDVIRGYADRLLMLAGADDYVCRYAGDEFVIVTRRPVESLGRLLDALSEPLDTGDVVISTAIGVVSSADEPGLSFRDLVGKASLLSTSRKRKGMAELPPPLLKER